MGKTKEATLGNYLIMRLQGHITYNLEYTWGIYEK